jgi:putative flippase GtrA
MSAKHGVDVVPVGQDELSNQGSLFKHAIEAKAAVTQRQVYALMAYYMALLIGCIALITFMIVNNDGSVFKDASEPDSKRLLQSMAFLLSGAVVGSVLYQIRMLFRFLHQIPQFRFKMAG